MPKRIFILIPALWITLLLPHFSFSVTYYTSINCTTSVNWNNTAAWATMCGGTGGNGPPGAADTVVICNGHTVNMNGNPGSCARLTISGTASWGGGRTTNVGAGGLVLQGGTITGTNTGTLNVTGPCTVPSGTFNLGRVNINISGATTVTSTLNMTSTQGIHTFTDITITGTLNNSANEQININGNLVNNGTVILSTGRVVFGGTSDATITGSSTTNFNTITVNKGSSSATVIDAQSLITFTDGGLTLTNGTLKLSNSSTTVTPFTADITAAPYRIPSTAGLWCNGATINSGNINWSVAGLLRISGGTVNLGNSADNRFLAVNAGTTQLTVEGGLFNVAGRISRATATDNITFTMSGGTIVVPTVGSTSATIAPIMIDQAGSSFTMSGGYIIIERPGGTNLGFTATAGTVGITGGIIQIGNANTPPVSTIQVNSSFSIANLLVDNSTVTAQLAVNLGVLQSITISQGRLDANNFNINLGNSWTNNGDFSEGTGTLTFDGTGTQTVTNPAGETFYNMTVSKPSGTVNLAANVTVSSTLDMSGGNIVTNGYQFMVGTGVVTPGSITYTAGTIAGSLKRWLTATGTNYLFPIGTSSYYRSALINFSALSSGTVTASFTSSDPGNNGLPYIDGATTVQNQFTEGYWDLTAGDGLSSTNYYIECTGNGFTSYSIGASTRLMFRATSGNPWSANGTHTGASGNTAKRTAVSGLSAQFAFGKPPCSSYAATYISGDTTVCTNQAAVGYSVNASNPSNTYTWAITGGSLAGGQGTPTITVTWGAAAMPNANVQVIEQNNCGDNNTAINRNIWINPIATSAINGPTTVAVNETGTIYSVTNSPEYIYTWSLPGGGGTLVSPQGNDSMTINWGAVAATYPVRVDAARLCGSPDFQTLNVQVRTTIQSAAGCSTNCNWVNTASWIGGVIPTANDYAEIQAGHTVIINQSTAVCRKLTINGSARWNAARTLTVGDKGIVVNTTGDIAGAGAGTCISQGGFTGINNANITSSTVTIVLQTNNANITSYGSLNRLQVTGITVTNTDTITIANGGSLTGTGTLAQSSNSSFVMQGTTFSVTGFDASATGNNVYYSANANQTVRSGTYEYLTLSGTSTKTLGGITIVNKDIKITGVTLDASTTNYALTVTGNWTNTGTYNPRFNTTTFNGGGTQTITNASGETFNNLNMSGAGTKILAGNVTINFDFTLNAPVNIGDNDMNIKGNFDNSSTYTASSNNDVTFSNSSIVTGSSPTQFINIIVTGALTGHASNMNVSGNWANNGTFNHNNGTVTFNGTTTVSGSSTTSFKNVTISGTLTGHSSTMNVAGNWTNNGTYNHNNGTLGFTGTSAQTIGGSVASETWRNLTINNSAGVALGHTGSLLGTLTLTDGAFNVSGQNFTIVSNGSGTGRIGPIPGAGTITGNFTMQRYVSGADGWRMLASPVSGTDIEGWDDNFITTGVPGSDYPAFSWVSLYRYDESQLGDQNSGWTYVSSTSDPMNPGTGIFAFISDVLGNPITTTLDQTGSLTSGTQAISVTYTDDPGQPDSEDGWNLVGNPYPSDIDWSLVSRSATVTPFAYVWNENTSSYVTYDANDPAGSNSIASHQAFWVKTSGGNGTVTIDEPDKSTELDPYYKVGVPTLLDLSLTIKKNAFVSTSRIRTRENGTPAYETEYDALLARSITPGAPNIFSLSSDSVELVVNSIPDTFNNISIPVQIDSGSPGNYSILIKKNALPPATCAILETVPDGIFYDLLITDSFTINVQTNTTQTRIILHLGAPFAKQTVNPTCNGFADGMAIISPQGSGPWDYVWKDSGENVIKTTSGSMIPDTLSGLPSGVFYGEVTSANTSCNKNYDAFIIQDPPMSIEAVADVIPPTCFENSDGMIDLMVTGSAPPFAYLWSDGATSEDRNGLPAGTFTVIVRDADNCPANGTFNIVPPEQVVAAFAISDDTVYINQGGTSSFINTSTGGDIFTWDFGDGSIVDSAVNTEHTFSDTGIYLVSLNVSNDACEDMVIIPLLVLQDKPGSIQSYIPSAEGVQVLQPDRKRLLIQFNYLHVRPATVDLFEITGKNVFSSPLFTISSGVQVISLDQMPEGIYYLKVLVDETEFSRKIILLK